MKKTNKFAIPSFLMAVLAVLVMLFWQSKETVITAFIIIIIVSIIAIVLGLISKKQIKESKEKGNNLATASIVIGAIFAGIMILTLVSLPLLKKVEFTEAICETKKELITNCKDNNDGTSTCSYGGYYDIICPNKTVE